MASQLDHTGNNADSALTKLELELWLSLAKATKYHLSVCQNNRRDFVHMIYKKQNYASEEENGAKEEKLKSLTEMI